MKALTKQLEQGQKQLENALEQVANQLSQAGAPGLKQLTDNLGKAIAIGVNVQQGAFPPADEPSPTYRFMSALAPTPDQATPGVAGQGVVRAIEIKLANGQGASLALGNAAAGPGSRPAPPRSAPPTPVPSTAIPTGVPAGNAAGPGGTSPLPLVVLLLVVALGGGGALAYRTRGRFTC